MNRRNTVAILSTVVLALGVACAQDDNQPSSDAQAPQQPVAAYGQDNAPSTPITENPPLSGLDLPSLQEHAAPMSYLQPGATFSQSATTNIGNTLGYKSWGSISRGLGTLELRRLWSRYDLALNYMGGAAYYNQGGVGWRQLQDLGFTQKIDWKRGQLSLRDSFGYLPEGTFGAPYGSLGSVGTAGMGSPVFSSFWSSGLGAFGLAPRIMNLSLAELAENLTPKSAVTATAGYAFTHFYGKDVSGASFIGSSQITGQAGYNHILTSHTQVAVAYGYQGFDFTVAGTAYHSHVVQGMYGHRISGRMDFLAGAGPQITFIDTPTQVCIDPTIPPVLCLFEGRQLVTQTARNTKLGVAAQTHLRYRFPRTFLDLGYERYQTSGAGLFAGAQTDLIHFSMEHRLSRVWSLTTDLGYSHNDRLQPLTSQQISGCLKSQGQQGACPANDAYTYIDGYGGAAVHRYFGREFHAFLSYQFDELSLDHSYCLSNTQCNRIANRNVVTFGLDWTPRPIRID